VRGTGPLHHHTVTRSPLALTFSALRERHAALLFDAYGVLIDAGGALPGAVEAIATLDRAQQPFLVVTNDASRSPENAATRLQRLGFAIRPAHIMSSGMMIAPALVETLPPGSRVVVLGTPDSAEYARGAGMEVVEASNEAPADAVVIADEGGFDLLEALDDVLSMVAVAAAAGRTPRLLLANPDLIYPAGPGRFGVTAGSLALVIEHSLRRILGAGAPTFEPLGKPATRIFTEAIARVGTRDAVMIGDQLETDIIGAASAGLATALILGGVTTRAVALGAGDAAPDYVLTSLE
jgi:HAD superfamily hydrolase (TIGR01450 family)